MIRSVLQLVAALALMLFGAWLIGWWAVGAVLVLCGALVAADALLRDDPGRQRKQGPSNEVLERWRRAK